VRYVTAGISITICVDKTTLKNMTQHTTELEIIIKNGITFNQKDLQ
jgi:hypothetical protein